MDQPESESKYTDRARKSVRTVRDGSTVVRKLTMLEIVLINQDSLAWARAAATS